MRWTNLEDLRTQAIRCVAFGAWVQKDGPERLGAKKAEEGRSGLFIAGKSLMKHVP